MAYIVTTYGIFDGAVNGVTKSGKPWNALTFRIPEDINGISASPEMLRNSNLRIFLSDNQSACDLGGLVPTSTYDLKLMITTTGRFDILGYQARK